MPLYTYQCKECGVRFERTQSFNDAPLKVCPECEGEVYRVISASGVIFKGSGFYVTDNRRSSSTSSTPKAKTETTGTGDSGTSTASTTESAPATASTTSKSE